MQEQKFGLSIISCLDSYKAAISALFEAISFAAPTSTNDHQARLDKAIDTIIKENEAYCAALDEGACSWQI